MDLLIQIGYCYQSTSVALIGSLIVTNYREIGCNNCNELFLGMVYQDPRNLLKMLVGGRWSAIGSTGGKMVTDFTNKSVSKYSVWTFLKCL